MIAYPSAERQECGYAIRYLKWLHTSGAASEAGPDAVAILSAVVTQEDEVFYRRAPNFFNDQLMSRCGIGSEPALIRARQRAVDAGLLVYEPGAKRRPGRYFSIGFTNESLAKAQLSVSESGLSPNDSLAKAQPSNTHTHTHTKEKGAASAAVGSSKKNPPKFDPASIELPPVLDTPRFRAAWSEWCADRKERKKPLTPRAAEKQLRSCAEWGEEKAIQSIRNSLGEWIGLFEPKGAAATNGHTSSAAKPVTPIKGYRR